MFVYDLIKFANLISTIKRLYLTSGNLEFGNPNTQD